MSKDKKNKTKDESKNNKPVGEIKNLNTTTKGLFEYREKDKKN